MWGGGGVEGKEEAYDEDNENSVEEGRTLWSRWGKQIRRKVWRMTSGGGEDVEEYDEGMEEEVHRRQKRGGDEEEKS